MSSILDKLFTIAGERTKEKKKTRINVITILESDEEHTGEKSAWKMNM